MKKWLLLLSGLFICLLLTGCAGVTNVGLANDFWQTHQQKIVVARSNAQAPQLLKIGQQGLLDVAINDIATQKFQNYLRHINVSWYPQLQQSFSNRLRARGVSARVLNQPIDVNRLSYFHKDTSQYAQFNYMVLANSFGTNKLLLLQLNSIGAKRSYYGFIPLGAPIAFCNLEGELIDLTNNRVLWRETADISLPVENAWNQPPNYPNFTRALNQTIDTAIHQVLSSFFR